VRVAIMGAGGISGYFGGRLAQGGADVAFTARGAHLAALRKDGLRVRSKLGDLHLPKVLATDDPRTLGRVVFVLMGVKLWDTEAAAHAIAPPVSGETAVVSFQNGVEKDDVLRSVLGDAAIMGGVSYIAAAIAEPGVIAHNVTMQRSFSESMTEAARRAPKLFLMRADALKLTPNSAGTSDGRWEKFVFPRWPLGNDGQDAFADWADRRGCP
jgi:2-dehydropantoate 2-reductase